jgi:hypothetical protein
MGGSGPCEQRAQGSYGAWRLSHPCRRATDSQANSVQLLASRESGKMREAAARTAALAAGTFARLALSVAATCTGGVGVGGGGVYVR